MNTEKRDTEISRQELEVFSRIGRALWASPKECSSFASESLSAAHLLELDQRAQINRAVRALLFRVQRMGVAVNIRANLKALSEMGSGSLSAFYQLAPEQRLLLVATHCGGWSYRRLAEILEKTIDQVEAELWQARLTLIRRIVRGPSRGGAACPPYDPSQPWSQRFMDDEIPQGREKAFLQNHLMACDSCRAALNDARKLISEVDQVLRAEKIYDERASDIVESLEFALAQRPKSQVTFWASFNLWIRNHNDAWIALVVVGWVLSVLIFRMMK